ncbi:MAG TPA: TonB-dependent receptor [Sphingomonas sp.]|nr:TonB-dependent receptor [Sphingomonas sp.]
MTTPRLVSMLLLSTALVIPALAHAQNAGAGATAGAATPPAAAEAPPERPPEVSIPGAEVVVTGQRVRNIVQAAPQVVSVLTTAEIARTGEGNIAGALGRVTGLSVVGAGFVYVRGLGDRYSLALLNGLPLPSPEPLRRVVPLDLFPSSIIASSLVQKSYSPNFPGEFGGGVINLTTKAIPQKPFLTIGAGISADTETTGQLGYTYYGSRSDWTGFDNGQRDIPPALAAFFKSGARISSGTVDTIPIASQLVYGRNAVVQRWGHMPPNFSGSFSAGSSFPVGSATLGVIAAAGYNNRWLSRDAINQTSLQGDLSQIESDFRRVTTDDRIVVNGLLGMGLELDNNRLRWTNLYIRDTLKHTRLGLGRRGQTSVDFRQQDTAWYERQLIDTQLVAELKPLPNLSVDLRGSYANSQREAPSELSFEYVRTNVESDPYGAYFVNRLNNGNGGDATISFSDLNENLWTGGADVSFKPSPALTTTVGYAYTDTRRTSSRRDFQFQAPSTFPRGVDMLRPDYLLEPAVIKAFGVDLIETNEGNPAFLASLRNHAGYGKIDLHITRQLQLDAGVRYETARETVSPIEVFTTPGASLAATRLNNHYWLPAATLTWQFRPDMQLRVNASKTIARPQFRELIYQFYFDPDSNRMYRGNPLLIDSRLTNAEARYEWYLAPEQRFSLAGFYKRIKNPIESFVAGDDFTTSFANAPSADLYGAEIEVQKYVDLNFSGAFWADRRVVLVGNYTYTKSKLSVGADDPVAVFAASSTKASDFFRDGAQLTGQSQHLGNIQIGLEDRTHLSQQTVLLTYASKRVTSRGLANTGQPDIYEKPGLRVDLVLREGVKLAGRDIEFKLEGRNLTGTAHKEYQKSGDNIVAINNYDVGRVFSFTAAVTF